MDKFAEYAWEVGLKSAYLSNEKFNDITRLTSAITILEACDLDVLPPFVADYARGAIVRMREDRIAAIRSFNQSSSHAGYWLNLGYEAQPELANLGSVA